MARGETERAFSISAARDGIRLERAKVPWINRRGHFVVEGLPGTTRIALDQIFSALGGDADSQYSRIKTALQGDYYHPDTGTFIEVDESQHFTSYRALTLGFYPPGSALGFSLQEYTSLCEIWADRADKYFASKPAVAFGPGGRQRQRAYNDALRDLVTPAMGHPPLIRAAAPDRDGHRAYARVREVVRRLL